MQVKQELKFTYDTSLDPEIDEAVEKLVFLLQSKDQLIYDRVTPVRSSPKNVVGDDWPGKITFGPQPEKNSRYIGMDLGSTDKSG